MLVPLLLIATNPVSHVNGMVRSDHRTPFVSHHNKHTRLTMNLRTHLSRSNGYRELGMFDESILELEEIEGEDRWHSMVNH